MKDRRKIARLLIGILMAMVAPLLFTTCVGVGTDVAGGGTGGTGISTGSIDGFGSVVVNGMHYLIDDEVSPTYVTMKMFNGTDNSSMMARDLFRVGMVVTIDHAPGDNNARSIEYRDTLEGPISARTIGADNTLTILGQPVVVDNAALFGSLQPGDVVNVSGYVDSIGRIRAAYINIVPCSSMRMCPVTLFEIKGFVSSLSPSDFRIGPLPDGTGANLTVAYGPAQGTGLQNGTYVQVDTTDSQVVSGRITATGIQVLSPRTDFPENAAVALEGLVTVSPSGSGNVLSFEVEGKQVQTDGATQFVGDTAGGIRPDVKLQVRGTEHGGILSAAKISFP
jgi:Domain of unknown function (DUF5666)